jgi:hypothetical protein
MNPEIYPLAAKHTNFSHYLSLHSAKRNPSIDFTPEIPFTTRNPALLKHHTKNSFSTIHPTFQNSIIPNSLFPSPNSGHIAQFRTLKNKMHTAKWSVLSAEQLLPEKKHTLNINEILALTSARDKDTSHSAKAAHERFMEYCTKKCINGCLLLSEVCLINHSSICPLT